MVQAVSPRNSVAKLEEFAQACERRWPIALALCSIFLLSASIAIDLKRPFWNDELFTYYISRQPMWGGVWKVLLTGAEQLPPFFFAIIKASTSVLGPSRLGFRLPESIGFLVMCISIFWFLKKRVSPYFGLTVMLLPAISDAFFYSYEARPYGLVMGFGGLAMLCWQAASEAGRRTLSLAGLTICLACAVSCHYYAVFLLFPFALAESVRFVRQKQPDWPMYAALGTSLLPIALSLPLIRTASQYSGKFWAKPGWTALLSFFENLIWSGSFTFMLLILCAGLVCWLPREKESFEGKRWSVPVEEFALALGFIALPIIGIILARTVTGAFTERYAVSAIIGISLLVAWSLARISGNRPLLSVLTVATVAGCSLIVFVRLYGRIASDEELQNQTLAFLAAADDRLPIVAAAPHEFFTLSHREALNKQGHLVYLADVPLALQYTGTDTVERGLLTLRNYAPLDVQDLHTFVGAHSEFLLYDNPGPFEWLPEELTRLNARMTVEARKGGRLLYRVRPSTSVPPK